MLKRHRSTLKKFFSCCLFFKFKSCISLSNKKANKERVRAKLSRIEYTKTSETIFYVRIDPSKPIFWSSWACLCLSSEIFWMKVYLTAFWQTNGGRVQIQVKWLPLGVTNYWIYQNMFYKTKKCRFVSTDCLKVLLVPFYFMYTVFHCIKLGC